MRERKLQVFVSSTYLDLKEERQAAVEAILEAGHIPAGMELFTAGNESQWAVIKRWIDESDVYLLLLGGRYGSVDAASGKSYTQLEFEYAVEIGKARFSLVLSDKFIDDKVSKAGRDMIETMHGVNLRDFKNVVTSSLVKFCDDTKDIKLATISSLNEFNYDEKLVGWVRGNRGIDTGLLAEQIAKLSQENSALRADLAKQQNNITFFYNGLSYGELEGLLKAAKIQLDGIDNLFELFMHLGPSERYLGRIKGGKFDLDILLKYIHKLQRFKVIILYFDDGHMVKATEDGHNFYLKALSIRQS